MSSKSTQINKLVITPPKHLFWFLKEGAELDLNETSTLDMYVQQVITRGRIKDVKFLLDMIDMTRFQKTLKRIERFIPSEVREFWEDFIGSHQ